MKHSIRKTAALLTGVIFTVNTMFAAKNSQIFNFSAFAEETEYNTYTDNESNVFSYYILSDNTIAISSVQTESTGTIKIPSDINGLPVTSLGQYCMYGSSVSSIILPGTLHTIGAYAFSFSDIKEITIPEGVSEICECSFLGCSNLASVTFPESLASVGQMAFWDCSSLSEINIPQSGALTNISGTAFTFTSWMNQKQTKSDYVSVNDILIYAGAEDSVIPDNVSVIADNAISLDVFTLRIPDSVKKIEKDSLLYLNHLEEILFEGTEEEWNSIYEQEQDSEEPGYKILFLGEADLSKGDVNGNGNLNIDDASAVLDIYAKQAAGIAAAADDTILTAADVNENSAPDIEDAGAILSYYAQFSADLYPIWDDIIYGPDMKRPVIMLKNYGSSVTVEWQPDSQADGYEIYRKDDTESEAALYAVVSDKDTASHQDVNIDESKTYTYSVRPYQIRGDKTRYGKISSTQFSSDDNAILNAAELSPHDTFVCYDYSKVMNSTDVLLTIKLNSYDKETLEKFAAEHFSDKMTREEKLYTTMEWIHNNVEYAYVGEKWNTIANKTLTDAVFNYKMGQCLQYNGALASMMAYLGYDVNLIFLRNNDTGWQHFTCRVHINGKTYAFEAGNKETGLRITLLEPVGA